MTGKDTKIAKHHNGWMIDYVGLSLKDMIK